MSEKCQLLDILHFLWFRIYLYHIYTNNKGMSEDQSTDLLSSLFSGNKDAEKIPAENLATKQKLVDIYVKQLIEENTSSLIKSGDMLKKYLMDSSEIGALFMGIIMGFMDKDTKKDFETFRKNLKKLDTADETVRKNIEATFTEDKTKEELENLLDDISTTTEVDPEDDKQDDSVESLKTGEFIDPIEIKDENDTLISKVHLCIPTEYDPTTQPLNMFFNGQNVTTEKMKTTVFNKDNRKNNQAYCIVEWDPVNSGNNKRYEKVMSKISTFNTGLYKNFGSQPKTINIIGHSAGASAALKYYKETKSDTKSTYKLISVDGVYGDASSYEDVPDAKVYYLQGWSNKGADQVKESIALTKDDEGNTLDHFSIIPEALEKEDILQA